MPPRLKITSAFARELKTAVCLAPPGIEKAEALVATHASKAPLKSAPNVAALPLLMPAADIVGEGVRADGRKDGKIAAVVVAVGIILVVVSPPLKDLAWSSVLPAWVTAIADAAIYPGTAPAGAPLATPALAMPGSTDVRSPVRAPDEVARSIAPEAR